jgi:hypothetical protein
MKSRRSPIAERKIWRPPDRRLESSGAHTDAAMNPLPSPSKRLRYPRYFVGLGISAAVMFVLGGEVAVPAGECASEASRGLDSTGVTGAT